MDQLKASVGVEALIIGAGPTGLILAQMLRLNGAARVVIAANKGIKMDLAKQLDAGTEYIELDRENPQSQWEQLKKENPYGFDVVVSACTSQRSAKKSSHKTVQDRSNWDRTSSQRLDRLRPSRRDFDDLRGIQ